MKLNKLALISTAALMGIAPLMSATTSAHTVQAATNRAVMHTAIAYDKNGNSTGKKYYSYQYVTVESNPVKIDGTLYYKVSGKDQYLKATNIDGVTRKITHNAYIYKSSNGRTSYMNRWKLYKGETVTTYGGSYKFKNGKRYFRIAGPRKQYIKSYNLGPVIKVNTVQGPTTVTTNTKPTTNTNNTSSNSVPPMSKDETTVTVLRNGIPLLVEVPGKDKVQPSGKYAKNGEKFTVDYLEQGIRAGTGEDGDDDWEQAIYHIKGTDYWILNLFVNAAKKMPVHNYTLANRYSLIRFTKATDLYNTNGTPQNIKLAKNSEEWKVDKLLYIWVPSENKAEEFYHLAPVRYWQNVIRLSNNGQYTKDYMPLKADNYVKASDVKFVENSVKITPSNTPEEAQAVALKK